MNRITDITKIKTLPKYCDGQDITIKNKHGLSITGRIIDIFWEEPKVGKGKWKYVLKHIQSNGFTYILEEN